jgi:hypothetical protein
LSPADAMSVSIAGNGIVAATIPGLSVRGSPHTGRSLHRGRARRATNTPARKVGKKRRVGEGLGPCFLSVSWRRDFAGGEDRSAGLTHLPALWRSLLTVPLLPTEGLPCATPNGWDHGRPSVWARVLIAGGAHQWLNLERKEQ